MNTCRYLWMTLLLGTLANARELAVRNHSFESPQARESTVVEAWLESRTDTNLGGYLMSKNRDDMPDTPHGTQWLELIGQPGHLADVYQQIGTCETDSYCTVSLLLGNRRILPDADLSIELWAGGDPDKAQSGTSPAEIGARLLASTTDIALPPNGATNPITRSLATGKQGKAGEPLWLRLVQRGDLQKNAVVLIDNVSAKWTDQPVEPAPNTVAHSPAPGTEAPYSIRNLQIPEGVVTEAGGLAYWPDGTLVFSTRRGDIWTIRDDQWNLFASGLLEPMGIWADTVGEVYVSQTPELTRIRDSNGDLSADRYETVTADWEIPGATADFVYGLCRDKEGNFYGTMHTSHGPWSGKSNIPGKNHSVNNFGGPMGAPVIGRGWSYQVDPKGKLTWWSSGLRAPNGVAFNADGDLFATDNQGDWVGTSAMHHIEQGDFHGHPSSYQWDPKRTVDMNGPLDQLAVELDKIRKRPVVLFPHGILGNSPSQPVLAPADGGFGPFAGQFFVGDNVAPLLSRVYLEKIDGAYQGVCFPFIRDRGLNKALCRMVFSPQGKLIIAFGCRGWGPATEGLQEVSWSGKTPFEMQKINLQSDGFKITFTKPLSEQDLANAFSIQSYRYKYHHTYGSPQIDVEPLGINSIAVSSDRRVVTLHTPPLEVGKIYEFKLTGVTAGDGGSLVNRDAYYTLNQLQTKPTQAATDKWTFFPLCMDTHDSAKRSLAEQAQLFRELGYDGCGHICQDLGYGNISHPPNTTVEQRARTLADQDLRLVQAYGRIYLERGTPINMARLKEMMPTLAKHKSQLVLLLLGDRKADLDDKAVALLGEIADLAKPHGVQIALYPHSSDYTETLGEALRVVKKLNRPDEVGVMFTFQHWKNCDPNQDVRAVLTDAAPWLKSVSINGTNKAGARVLPLDQGDFDVGQVLDILRDIGFRGPVGLMCWSIGGDARTHLDSSMQAWRNQPAVVAGASSAASTSQKKCKIVFIGGADSHGPGAHDHKAGAAFLKSAIEQATNISDKKIETALYLDRLPDDLSALDDAAAIVLMWEGWDQHLFNAKDPKGMAKFGGLMRKGVGLLCLHAATAVGDEVEAEYLTWSGGNKKFGYSTHPMTANVDALIAAPKHPIARGVGELRFEREEFYRRILIDRSHGTVTPILTASPAVGPPEDQMIAWAFERKTGGRTFCCTGPHFHKTFDNPEFRRLILNAILWVAQLDPPAEGVREGGGKLGTDPS